MIRSNIGKQIASGLSMVSGIGATMGKLGEIDKGVKKGVDKMTPLEESKEIAKENLKKILPNSSDEEVSEFFESSIQKIHDIAKTSEEDQISINKGDGYAGEAADREAVKKFVANLPEYTPIQQSQEDYEVNQNNQDVRSGPDRFSEFFREDLNKRVGHESNKKNWMVDDKGDGNYEPFSIDMFRRNLDE